MQHHSVENPTLLDPKQHHNSDSHLLISFGLGKSGSDDYLRYILKYQSKIFVNFTYPVDC